MDRKSVTEWARKRAYVKKNCSVYAPFNYRSDILMKKKSPKWDIFAGNVHGSGGYVLTFSLVLLLFAVGFSVMIKAYAKRWEPEVYLVTAFTEPSVKDHDLTVVSAMDGKSYIICITLTSLFLINR